MDFPTITLASTGEPLYIQIANQLRSLVATGTLAPGSQLPTIRKLSLFLAVNSDPVIKAIHLLAREGLLDIQRGRGTFVIDPLPDQSGNLRKRELISREIAEETVSKARTRGVAPEDVVLEIQSIITGSTSDEH
ncbi:GntR family transcriptional regulator [Acetobacter fallax]|uniref:GntR family transcriptional regulator n=1 Tax=Acetobacter fallax TaxID=1737473 RepID=A0ABX0KA82_9PROT|nr:GntR family transcriptional regulator [Acetobacter fallax]NHO31886.1 GntR family transcriptional regulator [Acetobacter fallax]NHO35351.1 GntR family transcriptional regulator [Acetobacter fallax]